MPHNTSVRIPVWSARRLLLSLGFAVSSLFGQAAPRVPPAAVPERPAKEPSSLELQRRSIQLMRESVAAQKVTARRRPEVENSSLSLPFLQGAPLAPLEPAPECEPLPEVEVASLIATASTTYNVRPDLLRSVMRRESAFRPCAVSPKGALGLMQIMPQTADDLNLSDPLDPAKNVDAGARYLRDLIKRFGGDLKLALAAYNAGPARVDSQEAEDIPETQNYVEEILKDLGAAPANTSRPGGRGH